MRIVSYTELMPVKCTTKKNCIWWDHIEYSYHHATEETVIYVFYIQNCSSISYRVHERVLSGFPLCRMYLLIVWKCFLFRE